MRIFYIFLIAVFAASGCSKDMGNYSYHPINDASATVSRDTFNVIRLDTLRISPNIQAPDVSRLRYEWRVTPVEDPKDPLGMGTIEVLSRQRDFNEVITLKARNFTYTFDLVMIDTVTGVNYFKHLFLNVTTAFQTGWMMLEEEGGNKDISFITPENKVFHHVYSQANPDLPLPATTHTLSSINTNGLLGNLTMAYFDNEGYTLDNTSLAVSGKYSQLFYSAPASVAPKYMLKPSIFSYGPFTISGDKIYGMNSIFTSVLFGAAYTQPDNLGYSAAPWVAGGLSYGAIFFDQGNYRFLYDGGGTSTSLKAFPSTSAQAFDMSNVHKKMVTMKAGMGWDLWPDSWYAIFKNEGDDSCFLYTVNANGNLTTTPVAQGAQAILASPGVSGSPDYLFSSTVKQMYYAAGNQLYVYDMAANSSRVVYTFSPGEVVTALQMRNNVITVATFSGGAGGGTVYDLPISGTGDISGNMYSQKNGGFGKIISLVFKVG